MTELIDVVDENDSVVRTTTRKEVREKRLLHRSATIIVKDARGRIFVQKRSMAKDLWPGMHAVGVGETVKAGEGYDEAAKRGLMEEIGIAAKPDFLFSIRYRSREDNENGNVYTAVAKEKLRLDKREVESGFFATDEELKSLIEKKEFEPFSRAVMEKYRKSNEKLIDMVDEDDNVIGKGTYEEVAEKGKIFRSANILVFNSKGQLLVHKRNRNLRTFPGMWDTKLGGIVDSGESYEEAARRELKEEAGIENAELQLLFPLKYRTPKYKNNRMVYTCVYDGKLKLQEEEVEEAKFVTVDEARRMKGLSPSAIAVLEKYLKWKK